MCRDSFPHLKNQDGADLSPEMATTARGEYEAVRRWKKRREQRHAQRGEAVAKEVAPDRPPMQSEPQSAQAPLRQQPTHPGVQDSTPQGLRMGTIALPKCAHSTPQVQDSTPQECPTGELSGSRPSCPDW